jgi:predicted transcriptional regulator
MIKTQIQLPDGLYRQLKHLASEREWSLAETLRRAAELYLTTQATDGNRTEVWQLPEARHCGLFLAPEEEWSELAHEG